MTNVLRNHLPATRIRMAIGQYIHYWCWCCYCCWNWWNFGRERESRNRHKCTLQTSRCWSGSAWGRLEIACGTLHCTDRRLHYWRKATMPWIRRSNDLWRRGPTDFRNHQNAIQTRPILSHLVSSKRPRRPSKESMKRPFCVVVVISSRRRKTKAGRRSKTGDHAITLSLTSSRDVKTGGKTKWRVVDCHSKLSIITVIKLSSSQLIIWLLKTAWPCRGRVQPGQKYRRETTV